MKLYLTILLISLLHSGFLFAQDQQKADSTATEEKEVTDKPVKFTWESGYLINQMTSKISPKKTLEFVIQHRFGTVENGHSDLWGIYSPGANVRIALDYVIYKNIQIGYGLTRTKMASDFNAKWTLIQQKTESMPISITLYGNVVIDGTKQIGLDSLYNYSDPSKTYGSSFSNRLSYFSQIIIGSKLNEKISLQGGVSFSHYNTVAALMDHDLIGAHIGGRYKVSPQGSIVFNADIPLHVKDISEGQKTNVSNTSVAVGYEVSTGSHAFQIFAGTSNSLLPQENIMYNLNKIEIKTFSIGFVITRLWSF